ncbi:hypothetical protein MSAN_01176900 [Mycena sanguinolenta]|uniref:Uncharacterized protein n=1 Tax=Mycena sanguinolenta TaxID=230812 RepID=A0A8H7D791_9AGAR|nr:hypothetical protein MSAN_01176900 [Mycena sanguinolenta]
MLPIRALSTFLKPWIVRLQSAFPSRSTTSLRQVVPLHSFNRLSLNQTPAPFAATLLMHTQPNISLLHDFVFQQHTTVKMCEPVSLGLLYPVSLGLVYLYMTRKPDARRQPSSSPVTHSRPSNVPHASEDADLPLAIALSLEEAKACVPAIVDTPSTANTFATMGTLESVSESCTNAVSFGHSAHAMMDPIEGVVDSQRSVDCPRYHECNGATGVGGPGEGPYPHSMNIYNSILSIAGGTGGNGGAGGFIGGNGGTGQGPILRFMRRLFPRRMRRLFPRRRAPPQAPQQRIALPSQISLSLFALPGLYALPEPDDNA